MRHSTNFMTNIALQLRNASAGIGESLVRERVNLLSLAQRACDYYRHVAQQKSIQIIYGTDVDSPYVATDRVAVAVVLDNLLSNAAKFSDPGARIWVSVSVEPGYLVCSVRDEGPGISAKDQEKLYQWGVRLTNLPTGGEPSTGYGLAVAKDLIDRLGGQLWCESKTGQGTTFSVRLPAHPEEPDSENC